MTSSPHLVAAVVTGLVGVALALFGLAAFAAGQPTRIAGPLKTRPDYGLQIVGLVLFVVGVAMLDVALRLSGWLA